MRTVMIHLLRSIGLLTLILSQAQVVSAADIEVRLDNPPPSGRVALVLFDSANTFGDLRDPYKVVIHDLDGRDQYSLQDIERGEYALLVYYDENDNGRIDRNFIGIPIEPLGFSNRYRPKGPPSYKRAAFTIEKDENLVFDVELYRPLGEFGRLGVGVGVIARSSPYVGYSGAVSQVIPAITYNGDRLQINGPKLQLSLVGTGDLRLAVTGRYRIGVYDEDDSDFLKGMGDREDTFMAGLAIQAVLPGGFEISAGYEYDVLDRIGGGEGRLSVDKSLQFGIFRLTPEVAINWTGSRLSNHDFGVTENESNLFRPVYTLDDTMSFEAGASLFIEITRDWLVFMNVAVEALSDDVTASPIVGEDHVIKGFAAINYVF